MRLSRDYKTEINFEFSYESGRPALENYLCSPTIRALFELVLGSWGRILLPD